MRNSITPHEVHALTMVTAFAKNNAESMDDCELKDMILNYIQDIKTMTGELEWKSTRIDDYENEERMERIEEDEHYADYSDQ